MISIVIPLYNKEKQITQTITSVLKQTYQSFEIVIVNDGSTDNSVEEIKKIIDTRIRLIHQENAGVSVARNRGIEEARYEQIAFLDADDEWKPTYLETQEALYKKYPECSVYACNYEFRDSNGKIIPTIIRKLPFDETDGELSNYFEVASCSHPPICSISIMVKKEAIQSIGGFPLGIKSGEDLLTWARLAHRYKIAYNTQPLSIYQLIPDSLTDIPKRLPAADDYVGHELHNLLKEKPNRNLCLYNSHWHKMRCSIYMRFNLRKEAIKEAIKALKFNGLNYTIYIYIILIMLPSELRKRILKNR